MQKSKRILSRILIVAMIAITTGACAQEEKASTMVDEVDHEARREVEKHVEVTVKDGVKTVKISTTENGETTIEKYTGEAAEKYLSKKNKEHVEPTDKDIDIQIEGDDFENDEVQQKMDELIKTIKAEIGEDDNSKVKIRIISDSDNDTSLEDLDVKIDIDGEQGDSKKVIVKQKVIVEQNEK